MTYHHIARPLWKCFQAPQSKHRVLCRVANPPHMAPIELKELKISRLQPACPLPVRK